MAFPNAPDPVLGTLLALALQGCQYHPLQTSPYPSPLQGTLSVPVSQPPPPPPSASMLPRQTLGLEQILPYAQALQRLSPPSQRQAPQVSYAQSSYQVSLAKIEPSSERDAAVASCLRDARATGSSYRLCLERMVATHGYTGTQWKDYFLDRHDTIIRLVPSASSSPPNTVKKPILSTYASPVSLPSTQAGYASRKHARPASFVSRRTSLHPHKRARFEVYNESPSKSAVAGTDDDADDADADADDDDDDDDDFIYRTPSSSRGRHGSRAHARTMSTNILPTSPAAIWNEDSRASYLGTNEMGTQGTRITMGDLDAIAKWIASHEAGEWGSLSYNQRWEPFSAKFPQRSLKAWAETYRRHKGEIHRRCEIHMAQMAKAATRTPDNAVEGESSSGLNRLSEDIGSMHPSTQGSYTFVQPA